MFGRVSRCVLSDLHVTFKPISSLALFSCSYHSAVKLNKPATERRGNFEHLGSWNNRINFQFNVEESIKYGKLIPKISLSHIKFATVNGRRRVNEDRFIARELGSKLLLFGVFDGHGGALTADYAAEHMQDHIMFWLRTERDLRVVLKKSFVDLNNAYMRHLFYNHAGDDTAMNAGTTATVGLLRNSIELAVGHVGDSQALLCREGRPLRLTIDHNPEVKEEKERIRQCGGTVASNSLAGGLRVNGRLAMTRSIGDPDLKCYGVIAEPQVRSIEIKHGNDSFLALSTDGINMVMSDKEIVDVICSRTFPQEAVNNMTDQALHYGSDDNCSAMIVPFGAWGKFANGPNLVTYSFGRSMIGRRYN